MAVPAATPFTRPALVTVAMEEGKLLHVPPLEVSVRAEEPCTHNVTVPAMLSGEVRTVSVLVTVQPVPSE